jgi:hypothetical protein
MKNFYEFGIFNLLRQSSGGLYKAAGLLDSLVEEIKKFLDK